MQNSIAYQILNCKKHYQKDQGQMTLLFYIEGSWLVMPACKRTWGWLKAVAPDTQRDPEKLKRRRKRSQVTGGLLRQLSQYKQHLITDREKHPVRVKWIGQNKVYIIKKHIQSKGWGWSTTAKHLVINLEGFLSLNSIFYICVCVCARARACACTNMYSDDEETRTA